MIKISRSQSKTYLLELLESHISMFYNQFSKDVENQFKCRFHIQWNISISIYMTEYDFNIIHMNLAKVHLLFATQSIQLGLRHSHISGFYNQISGKLKIIMYKTKVIALAHLGQAEK